MSMNLSSIGNSSIIHHQDINSQDYEQYCKHKDYLVIHHRDQDIFRMVVSNYDDYIKLVGGLSSEDINLGDWNHVDYVQFNFSRHILNFLFAMRSFLDHSEVKIKRLHGEESQIWKEFRESCSQAYDSSFSYRFMYRLRNYLQHIGMPPCTLNTRAGFANPDRKEIVRFHEVLFNRDTLLEFDGWGKALRDELVNLPSQFDVTGHVTTMMTHIKNINITIIKHDIPQLAEAANYIYNMISTLDRSQGLPAITNSSMTTEGRLDLSIEWIPIHLVFDMLWVMNFSSDVS